MSIDRTTLEQLSQRRGQLLQIGLDPVLRFSTRGDLDVLGATWYDGDFTVGGFEEDEHGINALSVSLSDPDLALGPRFLREFTTGITVAWYLIAQQGNDWATDLVFLGELDQPRITESFTVELEARLATGNTELTPRVPFESPYSLARGEERVINGATYRVE